MGLLGSFTPQSCKHTIVLKYIAWLNVPRSQTRNDLILCGATDKRSDLIHHQLCTFYPAHLERHLICILFVWSFQFTFSPLGRRPSAPIDQPSLPWSLKFCAAFSTLSEHNWSELFIKRLVTVWSVHFFFLGSNICLRIIDSVFSESNQEPNHGAVSHLFFFFFKSLLIPTCAPCQYP